MRIAYSPTLGYVDNVDPEVAAAVDAAVGELADLGAVVEAVDPGFDDPLEITTGLWFTGAWTLWNQLSSEQQAVTDPDFAAEARLGAPLSNLEVQRLVLRRGELGSTMRQFMHRYDLLVTPSVAVPAFEARPAGHTPLDPVVMLGWTPFSYPFNLTQQPACTIPCGLTSAGLPIGMQFVGPMFADSLVLRAARAYETHPSAAGPPLRAGRRCRSLPLPDLPLLDSPSAPPLSLTAAGSAVVVIRSRSAATAWAGAVVARLHHRDRSCRHRSPPSAAASSSSATGRRRPP